MDMNGVRDLWTGGEDVVTTCCASFGADAGQTDVGLDIVPYFMRLL